MTSPAMFYLCPTCFVTTTQDQQRHEHRMIAVSLLGLDADQRRPILDPNGHLLTQAPRWFVASTHPLATSQAQRPAQDLSHGGDS